MHLDFAMCCAFEICFPNLKEAFYPWQATCLPTGKVESVSELQKRICAHIMPFATCSCHTAPDAVITIFQVFQPIGTH